MTFKVSSNNWELPIPSNLVRKQRNDINKITSIFVQQCVRVYIGYAECKAVSFSIVSSLGKYSYRNCGSGQEKAPTDGAISQEGRRCCCAMFAPRLEVSRVPSSSRLSKQAPLQPCLPQLWAKYFWRIIRVREIFKFVTVLS